MFLGYLSLIGACLCWSLVFVIPLILKSFSPIEIAFGRFFCYGLISFIVLCFTKPKLLKKQYHPLWLKSSFFGFASTIFCFTSMVFCIRLASSSITALIYALSPITIALYGNFKEKKFTNRQLVFPLGLMLCGIISANLEAFNSSSSSGLYILGLICGFSGILSWTWYAVANARFMSQCKDITVRDWSHMMGSSMFFLVIILSIIISPIISWRWTQQFLIGSALLGTVATYFAFMLWNYGSKKVPVTIAGQMMILEVVFGLTLVYSYYKSLPSSSELIGMVLMLSGVIVATKSLNLKESQEVDS